MGLVEKEWLETLATVNPSEVTYTDYVLAGRMLGRELKEKGRWRFNGLGSILGPFFGLFFGQKSREFFSTDLADFGSNGGRRTDFVLMLGLFSWGIFGVWANFRSQLVSLCLYPFQIAYRAVVCSEKHFCKFIKASFSSVISGWISGQHWGL